MTKQHFDINKLRVAAPCSVGWAAMKGDDRRRLCDLCQLNVYNLSDMTAGEAHKFIAESEGRICGRFYKRADGTVLTKDCPVGFRADLKRVTRFAGAALTAVLAMFSFSFGQKTDENSVAASKVKILRIVDPARESALTGQLFDVHGAVIPGVEITLTGKDGNQIKTSTNEDGRYLISPVAKGVYYLKVESAYGFKGIEIKNIEINEYEKSELDIELAVDGKIEVVGLLGIDVDDVVTAEGIRQLPVNGRPLEPLPVNKKP